MSQILLLILVLAFPLSLSARNTPEFPTDNEITTLMQQSNLAMKQYEAAIQEEGVTLTKDDDTKKGEKNTIENWERLLSVIKMKPDNFNSGVGFMVVTELNNAYQDSLSCEINALTEMGVAFVVKDATHQNAANEVAKSCTSAAQLLAIVKVSATDLYEKYLQAHKVVYEKSLDAIAKCTEILKKAAKPQSKP